MKKITKIVATAIAGCTIAALACGMMGCGSNSSSDSSSDDQATAEMNLITDGTLTVGISPDYPPFENLVDGEIEGFDADVINAVADELGLKVEYKQIQFDGIQPAVVSGGQCDVGCSGFSITPEREKEVDFSDPYYTDDMAIAVMKDSKITSDNAKEELNKDGIIIAVQSGTTGESYAKENFSNATVKGFGNSTDCFAAVQAGKADAVCTNLSVVSDMLSEAYTDAQVIYKDATDEDYGIIVNKENTGLTAAINDALAKLSKDGTLDEIQSKWFA